jgi:hypothetical protein
MTGLPRREGSRFSYDAVRGAGRELALMTFHAYSIAEQTFGHKWRWRDR